MKIVPISVFLLALLLGGTACSDSIVSECDIPQDTAVPARFADIEQRVFAVSCALSGCHAGSNPQAGLDLSPGNAHDALVGVTSVNYPNQRRVEAGNSAQSVLTGVLRRQLQPVMPPAGPLESAVIDSIAAWIDRGALRN
ncbi:MAG: hypothetical protein JXA28_06425 [Bacteroidetes bacterium]|nr:hypothetical protein [Bacteroidota bacterium]